MEKNIIFSFRTDDPKIIDILTSLPARKRSAYIRDAILGYESIEKKLDEINAKLDKMLSEGITPQVIQRDAKKEDNKPPLNDLLVKSLSGFLNL